MPDVRPRLPLAHDQPIDHGIRPGVARLVTTGSSASTPTPTMTQPQTLSPPQTTPPPPYNLAAETGLPKMFTSASTPAAASWDVQDVQSLVRGREIEYWLKREHLVDEITRSWWKEWNDESLRLSEKLAERKLAVYETSGSWWARLRGCLRVENQYYQERHDSEMKMITVHRQKWRPLIEQLQQDYRCERRKYGEVTVVIHTQRPFKDVVI